MTAGMTPIGKFRRGFFTSSAPLLMSSKPMNAKKASTAPLSRSADIHPPVSPCGRGANSR
jgi:hypothetical protein